MRYFEIKVTACGDCPYSNLEHGWCDVEDNGGQPYTMRLCRENSDQLTPSCPMWNETKEQK